MLLDHLQRNTGLIDLIPRYATAKILDGVKEWYAKQDAMMRALKRPDQPNVPLSLCHACAGRVLSARRPCVG